MCFIFALREIWLDHDLFIQLEWLDSLSSNFLTNIISLFVLECDQRTQYEACGSA